MSNKDLDKLTPGLPDTPPVDMWEKLIRDFRVLPAQIDKAGEAYWQTGYVFHDGQYSDLLECLRFTHEQIVNGLDKEIGEELRRRQSRAEKVDYLNRLLTDLKVDSTRRDSAEEARKLKNKLESDEFNWEDIQRLSLEDQKTIYDPDLTDYKEKEAQAKLFGDLQALINGAFEWGAAEAKSANAQERKKRSEGPSALVCLIALEHLRSSLKVYIDTTDLKKDAINEKLAKWIEFKFGVTFSPGHVGNYRGKVMNYPPDSTEKACTLLRDMGYTDEANSLKLACESKNKKNDTP